MELRCGIDIIEIERIKESIETLGEKFLKRIYTDKEIEYCESKKAQKYQHYAARFAAKEAVFKAISEKIKDKYQIEWKDIEITNSKEGRPQVEIRNQGIAIKQIDVSLSHCKQYATANAIVGFEDLGTTSKSSCVFFDSHAHLDDEKFNEDREKIIEETLNNNTKFVTIGYSLESSKNAIKISNKYKEVSVAVGISPNDIPQNEEELWKQLDEIEDLATKNKKVVAIGEIGLDYYWNKENKELQKQAFTKQIDIANRLKLPITIHTRDSVMDTLQILKENKVLNNGIFHCCPLNRELVKEGLKLGFYISFSGIITFKNSKNADEIINMVPNDKILIETDSPYLTPEPFRGKRNNPINVKYVAEKIAKAKNISLEEVAEITCRNAEKIYKR